MRASWFDDKTEHPLMHEQITKLESFTSALADGVVSKQELEAQERRLVAGFRAEGVRWARSVVWWEATIPEARGRHRRRCPKGSAWRVPRLWTCSRHSTRERRPLDHR